MGKVRKVLSVAADSPLAKSAFFRRKEYDIGWQSIYNSVRKKRSRTGPTSKIGTNFKRGISSQISNFETETANYKPRVTKEEMEEMGCEPLGILTKNQRSKNRDIQDRHLSFSGETHINEKTPKRGTPLVQKCVVEMSRNKNKELEELEETVSKIERAVWNGTVSVEEALTDIEGLKFRRQAASSAKFLQLEARLRKRRDQWEACSTHVKDIFAARDEESKTRLIKELKSTLESIETLGDSSAEPNGVSDSEDCENKPPRTFENSPEKVEVKPTYTPENVESTPVVRTGSAAKTRLRFTPLLSSCQRRNNDASAMKRKRSSFKLTPLRRSSRVAASKLAQEISASYRAVDI